MKLWVITKKCEKKKGNTNIKQIVFPFGRAETEGFEPSCPGGLTHFEFSRRLLLTWFLPSVSVSLVRPQTRMKSGFFEEIARKY